MEIFKLEFSLSPKTATPTVHIYAIDEKGTFHIYRREHHELSLADFCNWVENVYNNNEQAGSEFCHWFNDYTERMLPAEYGNYIKHYKNLAIYIVKPSN